MRRSTEGGIETTSRERVEAFAQGVLEPLLPFFQAAPAGPTVPGAILARHDDRRVRVESFARPLWAVAALEAGGCRTPLTDHVLTGLSIGPNPGAGAAWGRGWQHSDQFAVEAASIAACLAIAPEHLFWPLSHKDRRQLVQWLLQINDIKLSQGNWQGFRLVLNTALESLGVAHSSVAAKDAATTLLQWQRKQGWFSDGPSGRVDYYNAFSIYPNLLLARRFSSLRLPTVDVESIMDFANSYSRLMTSRGDNVPFGRSLTYRFAQASFWAALAYSELDVDLGLVRSNYVRSMDRWAERLGDRLILLQPGYYYPLPSIAEYYISSASSYWACQAFISLALSQEHAFWSAKFEESGMVSDREESIDALGFQVSSSAKREQITVLSAGQWSTRDFGGVPEKYSKFAYSSNFGFSLSRSYDSLEAGAFDSMLAVRPHGLPWAVRRRPSHASLQDRWALSRWQPIRGVDIVTVLQAAHPWHLRWHFVSADFPLSTADGAFCVSGEEHNITETQRTSFGEFEGVRVGAVGIIRLSASGTASVLEPWPRTNIFFERTLLPTVGREVGAGSTVIGCLVLGAETAGAATVAWKSPPVSWAISARQQAADFARNLFQELG